MKIIIQQQTIAQHELRINNDGRVEGTRRYLAFIQKTTALEQDKTVVQLLNNTSPDVYFMGYDNTNAGNGTIFKTPRYGDTLFSSNTPYAGNTVVTEVTVRPADENDPFVWEITVKYGVPPDNKSGDDDDDPEQVPDEDKPTPPWKETASVSLDFGEGEVVVPDIVYGGNTMDAGAVNTAKSNPGERLSVSRSPTTWLNSAHDILINPPAFPKKGGTITINFSVRTMPSALQVSTFLTTYLHKINIADTEIGNSDHSFGIWTAPAGTLLVVGYSVATKVWTESAKWYPEEPHPFGWAGNNRTKSTRTVERSLRYLDISIQLKYDADGYMVYALDCGYRQLKEGVGLDPIPGPDGNTVTAPVKLDGAGKALDIKNPSSYATTSYFLEYAYYTAVAFGFLANIPWMGETE